MSTPLNGPRHSSDISNSYSTSDSSVTSSSQSSRTSSLSSQSSGDGFSVEMTEMPPRKETAAKEVKKFTALDVLKGIGQIAAGIGLSLVKIVGTPVVALFVWVPMQFIPSALFSDKKKHPVPGDTSEPPKLESTRDQFKRVQGHAIEMYWDVMDGIIENVMKNKKYKTDVKIEQAKPGDTPSSTNDEKTPMPIPNAAGNAPNAPPPLQFDQNGKQIARPFPQPPGAAAPRVPPIPNYQAPPIPHAAAPLAANNPFAVSSLQGSPRSPNAYNPFDTQPPQHARRKQSSENLEEMEELSDGPIPLDSDSEIGESDTNSSVSSDDSNTE